MDTNKYASLSMEEAEQLLAAKIKAMDTYLDYLRHKQQPRKRYPAGESDWWIDTTSEIRQIIAHLSGYSDIGPYVSASAPRPEALDSDNKFGAFD